MSLVTPILRKIIASNIHKRQSRMSAISGWVESYSKDVGRESRFMKKMLSQNSTNKDHKVVNVATPSLFPGSDNISSNRRRVAVLNKLFMKSITDILSTGNIDADLMDKGLEISRVAISPDFHTLNVFWFSLISRNEEDIEKGLYRAASKLHHELSQLRLMGFVPKINFVKDQREYSIEELVHSFQALRLADTEDPDHYEDDLYKKRYRMQDLKHCLDALSLDAKEEADAAPDVSEISTYNNIPPMTSNIYGLNHDNIMNKVAAATKDKQLKRKRTVGDQDGDNSD